MTFGENIRLLREERGYSLKDVELHTGINNGNLSRYERDINFPSIELCLRLANLYEVSLDELVGRESISSSHGPPKEGFHLSPEERKLVEDYRGLGKPLKELLQNMIRSWQESTRTDSVKVNEKR